MSNRWIYQRFKIDSLIKGRINVSYDDQTERERFSLIVPPGVEVYRVRIVGTVIDKSTGENNYVGLLVDDGSGSSIWIKDWQGKLQKYEKWDLLDISGDIRLRVHEQEQEDVDSDLVEEEYYDIYIQPVAVNQYNNANWITVHKLELMESIKVRERMDISSQPVTTSTTKETEVDLDEGDLDAKIKQLIVQLDEGEGVEYSEIQQESQIEEKKLEEILFNLMVEGSIYEPKPGYYRSLD